MTRFNVMYIDNVVNVCIQFINGIWYEHEQRVVSANCLQIFELCSHLVSGTTTLVNLSIIVINWQDNAKWRSDATLCVFGLNIHSNNVTDFEWAVRVRAWLEDAVQFAYGLDVDMCVCYFGRYKSNFYVTYHEWNLLLTRTTIWCQLHISRLKNNRLEWQGYWRLSRVRHAADKRKWIESAHASVQYGSSRLYDAEQNEV